MQRNEANNHRLAYLHFYENGKAVTTTYTMKEWQNVVNLNKSISVFFSFFNWNTIQIAKFVQKKLPEHSDRECVQDVPNRKGDVKSQMTM